MSMDLLNVEMKIHGKIDRILAKIYVDGYCKMLKVLAMIIIKVYGYGLSKL